jgi:predicted O-linked N-acetylglucosamine transferase (SPINDLY family)
MNLQIGFLLNKSLEALRNSNLESAELYLKQALRLQSKNPHILRLLGVIFAQRGQYSDALKYLNDSLRSLPKNSLALSNLGNVFFELKEYDSALDAYDKSIKIDPKYEEVWSNKGNVLNELKRYDEAIANHDRALSLNPDYAEGWSNKGNVLIELRRYDEAITHHDKALSLRPDYAEGWSNKGVALKELKRYDEAVDHHDKALSLRPDYAEAWSNKGIALNELKQYDSAIAHYEKALSLKPDINWIYGDLAHAKMKISSWSGLGDLLDVISKKVMANEKASSPFSLLALSDDPFLHKKCSEIYAQDGYPANSALGPIPKRSKKEKIRIAYFSADFRNHPVALLTAELYEIHDRDRFEVFAFSLLKSSAEDEMNLRLRKGFDRFIDVDSMSELQIAQLARELEVDIAIDLSGPTQHSRTGIFSYRAAPIQVNWLGYPGTIGADYIDYIVADQTIIPAQSQQFYSEKVAYLPDTYMVDDSKRIASSRIFTKEECGLPENTFIFCCFNNDYKFNSQVLDSWSKILLTVKNSVLWISENTEHFRVNIANQFERRRIDSTRIVFARREGLMADHLARYGLADLFLDTWPYNAHTTTVDALKAGVPVLTLEGQSFPSRVAASLLNAVRLPELITRNQEEYEALAIELAMNPKKLAVVKLKLANSYKTTPLFDTPLFAKNLETVYIKMHERYLADLQPDHIYID